MTGPQNRGVSTAPKLSWSDLDAAAVQGFPLDDKSLQVYLEDAAATLRAMPRASLKAHLTSWPAVVQDSVSLMVPSERTRTRPPAPHPRAIDRMDEVLSWLLACEEAERRILWARACKIPWRKLEAIDGRSHMTLRQVANRGLQKVRRHLRDTRGPFDRTNLERRITQDFNALRPSEDL
jgi:hypothetical protein